MITLIIGMVVGVVLDRLADKAIAKVKIKLASLEASSVTAPTEVK